jgi:GntR family transcriptional regulator, transcriptional repressor for pyruvate dehydrogenase complex
MLMWRPARELGRTRPSMAVKQYEVVAEQLRQCVVRGELKPDARLRNEVALVTFFRVSRATVREALRVLTAQNLMEVSRAAAG